MSPTLIAGYLALFFGFGFFFLFIHLVMGRFIRPKKPSVEKLEVYECGEPAIGSSFVQFDLRFYVVALLFIIFDVEVAFFFPWAAVFGKATELMDPHVTGRANRGHEGRRPSQPAGECGLRRACRAGRCPSVGGRCGSGARDGADPGGDVDRRYPRVLCGVAGRLRLRLAAWRPGLGPR